MIDTGDVRIAVNAEEAFWTDLKDKCLKEIETEKRHITINEEIIKLAEKKAIEASGR